MAMTAVSMEALARPALCLRYGFEPLQFTERSNVRQSLYMAAACRSNSAITDIVNFASVAQLAVQLTRSFVGGDGATADVIALHRSCAGITPSGALSGPIDGQGNVAGHQLGL